jgi:hypothetical protein
MLGRSAMICVMELQKRYGPETAHAALGGLRKYMDKLDRMFTGGSNPTH